MNFDRVKCWTSRGSDHSTRVCRGNELSLCVHVSHPIANTSQFHMFPWFLFLFPSGIKRNFHYNTSWIFSIGGSGAIYRKPFKNRVYGMGGMFCFPKKSMARARWCSMLESLLCCKLCLSRRSRWGVSVSNSEEPNREDGGGEEPPTKHQRSGDSLNIYVLYIYILYIYTYIQYINIYTS